MLTRLLLFCAFVSACVTHDPSGPGASSAAAATACPPEPTTLDGNGEPRNAAGDVRYCWPGEAFCYCDSDNDCYARAGYVPCSALDAGTTTSCPPEPTTLDRNGEPRNAAGDIRYCWPWEAFCHCDVDNDCYARDGYVPCSSRDGGTDAGSFDASRDAGSMIDTGIDAPRDVGTATDTGIDVARDVGIDARADTGTSCPPEPTYPDGNGEPRNAAGDIRYCWPWEAFCHCDSDNDCYARDGYVPCISAAPIDAGTPGTVDAGSTPPPVIVDAGTTSSTVFEIDTTQDRGPISRDLYGINVGDSSQSIEPVMSLAASFPLIRFPGGDEPQQFDWQSTGTGGCGDRVNWPIIANMLQNSGAALVMETNIIRSSPSNAAQWVADARRRGIRVPHVTIGNEVFGDWDAGYRTPSHYASDLHAHATAIRALVPGTRIGAAIGTHNDDAWNREMVRLAGDVIDVVEYHYYPNHREYERAIPSEIMAEPEAVRSMLAHLRGILNDEAPARSSQIEIAIGEFDCAEDPPSDPYDLVSGRAYSQWSMPNAVCYGGMIGEFIEAGVHVALMYDLQGYRFGSTRGKECEPGDTRIRRPKVLAQQLYRDHFGDRLVTVTPRNVPTYVSNGPIWWDGYAGVAPYLRSYASLADGGQSLRIIVVSRQPTSASTVTFSLQGFDPASTANVYELAGDSLMATNENVGGPVDAVRIVPKTAAVSGAVFTYVVPPHSVSAIELRRR